MNWQWNWVIVGVAVVLGLQALLSLMRSVRQQVQRELMDAEVKRREHEAAQRAAVRYAERIKEDAEILAVNRARQR